MSQHPSWCCQQCGDPIGWLGRLFHRCAKRGQIPPARNPRPEPRVKPEMRAALAAQHQESVYTGDFIERMSARFDDIPRPFALVRDRSFDGEGLSVAVYNGENWSFSDGDSFERDGDTLDGYEAEFLTHHQLEQRLEGWCPECHTREAEPSDGEIYQDVSERHATPEQRAVVAEHMAEMAEAVALWNGCKWPLYESTKVQQQVANDVHEAIYGPTSLSVEQILRLVCEHTGRRINLNLPELDQYINFARAIEGYYRNGTKSTTETP